MFHRYLTTWLAIVTMPVAVHSTAAGELLGKGRMYIRFTNLRTDATNILIRLNIVPNDEQPFSWTGKTVYVGRTGEEDQWKSSGCQEIS